MPLQHCCIFFDGKLHLSYEIARQNTTQVIFSSRKCYELTESDTNSNTIFGPWIKTNRYRFIRILRDTYGMTCNSKKYAKEIENDAEATPSASCSESRDESSDTRCESRSSFSVVENDVILRFSLLEYSNGMKLQYAGNVPLFTKWKSKGLFIKYWIFSKT